MLRSRELLDRIDRVDGAILGEHGEAAVAHELDDAAALRAERGGARDVPGVEERGDRECIERGRRARVAGEIDRNEDELGLLHGSSLLWLGMSSAMRG